MNLILSDRHLDIPQIECTTTEFIDLSTCKIANCIGCFGCWTKTPGKCVIRDDAVKVYPLIAASDRIMYISKVKYGGYDTIMKTMLERGYPGATGIHTHCCTEKRIMSSAVLYLNKRLSLDTEKYLTRSRMVF